MGDHPTRGRLGQRQAGYLPLVGLRVTVGRTRSRRSGGAPRLLVRRIAWRFGFVAQAPRPDRSHVRLVIRARPTGTPTAPAPRTTTRTEVCLHGDHRLGHLAQCRGPRCSAAFVIEHFGLHGDEWGRLPFPQPIGRGLQSHIPADRALDVQARAQKGRRRAARVFVVRESRPTIGAWSRGGVEITTPLQTEPWGERFFQVTDPNGIVIQLVQWVGSPRRRSA